MRMHGFAQVKSAARRLRLWFLIVPCMFLLSALVLPAIGGLAMSFDEHGPSIGNYRAIAGDPMFWRGLVNNLVVPIGSLVVELVAGLALALTLTARGAPGRVVQVAAILPFAIPEIVMLTLARYLLMPRGYVNGLLNLVGAHGPGWLNPGSALAYLSVIVVDAWHVTPVVMLILIAGLQTIPGELYEAARLDGAGKVATFRYVTLPMLVPAIVGAVVLRGVDALRIFSTTLVLTGAEGVPVLSTYSYQLWSDSREPRQAMAAAVALAILVTGIGLASLWAASLGRSREGASA